MTELKTYIIDLEDNKKFIHVSKTPEKVLLECEYLYDFVKQHQPICVIKILELSDPIDVNLIVKKYMRYYGIENVRGGSFTDIVLSNNIIQVLELEIKDSIRNIEDKLNIFENKYNRYEKMSLNDIETEISKINNELNIYYAIKDKYTSLKYSDSEIINRDIFILLDYLRNGLDISKIETNIQYKTIINKIKIVIDKYYQLDKDDIKIDYDNLFKYPNHLLDFYNNNNQGLQQFINKIEHMSYKLINIIDCLEFDLSTYNNNYEKNIKQELEHLHKRILCQ